MKCKQNGFNAPQRWYNFTLFSIRCESSLFCWLSNSQSFCGLKALNDRCVVDMSETTARTVWVWVTIQLHDLTFPCFFRNWPCQSWNVLTVSCNAETCISEPRRAVHVAESHCQCRYCGLTQDQSRASNFRMGHMHVEVQTSAARARAGSGGMVVVPVELLVKLLEWQVCCWTGRKTFRRCVAPLKC